MSKILNLRKIMLPLIATTLGAVVFVFVYMNEKLDQLAIGDFSRGPVWYVANVELDKLALHNALLEYAHGQASGDDVRTAFDILWGRLAQLEVGVLQKTLVNYDIDQTAYEDLMALLVINDNRIAVLGASEQDDAIALQFAASIADFQGSLRRAALSVLQRTQEETNAAYMNVVSVSQTVLFANLALVVSAVLLSFLFYFDTVVIRRALHEKDDFLEQLHELSSTDSLTGLMNRRATQQFLEEELSRSKRYGSKLSVAIIDIDHFKTVNDTYGHVTGDKVLEAVAKILESLTRENDKVGRWGGEEFLAICPETEIEGALLLFNRIRAAIEGSVFSNEVKITVSIGVTECDLGDSSETIVMRADNEMYDAKNSGRNSVRPMIPC